MQTAQRNCPADSTPAFSSLWYQAEGNLSIAKSTGASILHAALNVADSVRGKLAGAFNSAVRFARGPVNNIVLDLPYIVETALETTNRRSTPDQLAGVILPLLVNGAPENKILNEHYDHSGLIAAEERWVNQFTREVRGESVMLLLSLGAEEA